MPIGPPLGFGVTIAGAEFGTDSPNFCNQNPGTPGRDYLYPSVQTIQSLAARGIRHFRLPVRWERLQTTLFSELEDRETDRLTETLDAIAAAGGTTILDVHNYGRYRLRVAGQIRDCIIDEVIDGTVPVPRAALASFWRAVAIRFGHHRAVSTYGLMNEPHDMGGSDWTAISQSVVESIRGVDRETWLLVAGDDWSSAARFETANGPRAWIDDLAGRTAYEAHCYLDGDASGQYKLSYDDESRLDPNLVNRPAERLAPFIDWCGRNRVPGVLGELGVPAGDRRWNRLLIDQMKTIRDASMVSYTWAAGDWWGDYPMSIQPTSNPSADNLSLRILRAFAAG